MKKLLILATALLVALAIGYPTAAAVKTRYVPFLDRNVRVDVLREEVHTMDASFKDYGASGKEGARTVFGVNGKDVTIAIVDTGVDVTHEQLDGSKVIGFFDAINGRALPYDDNGHGTHVASIAAGDGSGGPDAAYYKGVAPGASILSAKVLDNLGRGTVEQVISGIAWAVDSGADIISMSLGMGGHNAAIEDAVQVAVDAGVVVVCAAGNSGSELDTIVTPASTPVAIAVGASSEWSGGTHEERSFGPYIAYFSSRGVFGGDKPDIVAPGVTVKAADVGSVDGYQAMSGTSMATPYVAGTVALMLDANPSLTPAEVKDVLRGTAFDAGPTGFDPDWGFGLVNTYSAVARVLGELEKNIFPPHYFYVKNHGFGATQCNFGSYGSCVITIGNGSALFGPQYPPEKANQPMAFTIVPYTTGVDLDAILVDMTNPGASSEYPWKVVTASLPSARPRRAEEFGVLPPTVGPFGSESRGYYLFVGPSMPFDDRATVYSFGIDIFYR